LTQRLRKDYLSKSPRIILLVTNLRVITLTTLFLFVGGWSFGQSTSDLQKEQIRLQKKITLTDKLIKSNKKDRKNSLTKLKLLKTQIASRKSLLNTYEKELKEIRSHQSSLATSVNYLRQRKDKLASNYSHLLQSSYRSKLTYNRWLFLLSAASFHQMVQRWRYLRHVNQAWKKQLETWHLANKELTAELVQLNQVEESKSTKLKTIKKETTSLITDREVHNQTIAKLAKDEKQLLKNLKGHHNSAKKLRKAIEAAVVNTTSKRKELPMTPDMKKLASSFADNKGLLPWPVDQGIIARPFGTHPHPTLPNIKVKNNGLDIHTLPGTIVKSIFEGKVIAHQIIPGFDNMVIVAHGNYYSVYSHLAEVTVVKGEQLSVGSAIGLAPTNSGTGEIHLEIWQGKSIMDPASWLLKN